VGLESKFEGRRERLDLTFPPPRARLTFVFPKGSHQDASVVINRGFKLTFSSLRCASASPFERFIPARPDGRVREASISSGLACSVFSAVVAFFRSFYRRISSRYVTPLRLAHPDSTLSPRRGAGFPFRATEGGTFSTRRCIRSTGCPSPVVPVLAL